MPSVPNEDDDRTPSASPKESPATRTLREVLPHMDRANELMEQGRIRAGSYIPVELAQLCLPYRDPKDLHFWERTNGNKKLLIEPALLPSRDGSIRRGFPFGSVPRLFLIWLTTEIKMQGRTDGQPIRVELGESLQDFMRQIGLTTGGGTQRRRVMDQLNRLVRARITILDLSAEGGAEGSWRDQGRQLSVASSWSLWHAGDDDDGEAPLMGSYIEVSPEFARSIDGAVPLATDVLRELQTHPMRLDIYCWLVHRMYRMRKRESRVTWHQLEEQFGGNYSRTRQFRAAFKTNLLAVRMYYPRARISVTKDGLLLRPSPKHIPQRGDLEQRGDKYDIARDIREANK